MGMGAMQQQQMLMQQQLAAQQAAALAAQQAQQPPAAPVAPTPPPAEAAGGGTPDVMTVEQAAVVLQVSPADVLAAIEAGDLKAKKIGSAYRISKANLDAFLNA